jgi:hypothetical protein
MQQRHDQKQFVSHLDIRFTIYGSGHAHILLGQNVH